MYVLIIPSWYYKAGSAEITGMNFHQLAHGLREQDIDARIFFASFSPSVPRISYKVENEVPTCRIQRFFLPKMNSTLTSRWIRQYADEVEFFFKKEGKSDVIHAQSYMAAWVAAEVSERLKIPFVYTEHLSAFLVDAVPSLHENFIRSASNSASIVTCVSPGLKVKLSEFGRASIEVIPNFYEDSIFFYSPRISNSSKFTWITTGDPSFTKGIDVLIRAFAKLKSLFLSKEICLIITDKVADKQELFKLAKSVGVDNNITWTGLLSQKELALQLRSADAYVSASRTETFGTAMVEAQACGLPVVATRTAGGEFIIDSPKLGILTEPDNVDLLATGMKEMMEKFQNFKQEEIAVHTIHRFEKKKIIAQWKNLYKQITQ